MYETLIREKTEPASQTQQIFVSIEPRDPEDPVPPPYVIDCVYPSYQKEFEALRTDNVSSRNHWKSCEHYKVSQTSDDVKGAFDLSAWYYGNNNHHTRGVVDDTLFGYYPWSAFESIWRSQDPPMYNPQPDGTFVPQPADLDELKQNALKALLPLMRQEMSLINSIIELKDFKSLAKGLITKIRNPGSVSPALKKFISTIKGPKKDWSLARLSKVASENYLQWSFAFAPLLSDIQALRRALVDTERRLNRLITNEGRVQTRHFSRDLHELDSYRYQDTKHSYGFPIWNAKYHASFGHEMIVLAETSKFHVEIEYNYNFTRYQREHARVLALLDALGVNFNPQIIWNAIPWSFAVDWVFGVNRWLDQFKMSNLEPRINIRQFLWSIKRSRRIIVNKQCYDYGADNPTQTVPMPTIHETAYRRWVGMPSISSITSSGLNPKEFSLGAALIIAKRRIQRRRR